MYGDTLFPKPVIPPYNPDDSQTPAAPAPAQSISDQTIAAITRAVTERLGLHVLAGASVLGTRHDLVVTSSAHDTRIIATVDLSERRGLSIDVTGQVVRIITPTADAAFAIDIITKFNTNRAQTDPGRLAHKVLG